MNTLQLHMQGRHLIIKIKQLVYSMLLIQCCECLVLQPTSHPYPFRCLKPNNLNVKFSKAYRRPCIIMGRQIENGQVSQEFGVCFKKKISSAFLGFCDLISDLGFFGDLLEAFFVLLIFESGVVLCPWTQALYRNHVNCK